MYGWWRKELESTTLELVVEDMTSDGWQILQGQGQELVKVDTRFSSVARDMS